MTVSRAEYEALLRLVEQQQQRIEQLEAALPAAPPAAAVAETERLSRRGLFAGLAAAAAGAAAGVAGATGRAEAATGNSLIAGSYYNTADHPTSLTYTGTTFRDYALGVNDGPLAAYKNSGTFCVNVQTSFNAAIYAENLNKETGRAAVLAYAPNVGEVALQGFSGGVGVYGAGTGAGTAVVAVGYGNSSTALAVNGISRFSRSGKVTVASGKNSAQVTLPRVTSTSLVFAMIQRATGLASVARIEPKVTTPTGFKIILDTIAPAAGIDVAWFVVDMTTES